MGLKESLAEVYSGKRVLITGHTGFKGSWLSTILHNLGSKIKGIALPPEGNSLYNSLSNQVNIHSVYSDIRSFENLKNEIIRFKPDFIFHLAAQPIVLKGYQEPRYTMDVNIMGTCNVLEVVRQLDYQCRVIVVTTDKVYEDTQSNMAYNESDRLGGSDPYSGSKAACELVTISYVKSYFNSPGTSLVGVARAGNVIGGGDYSEDRIIPDIIRALSSNQKILIRNPHSVRPWQHVIDPLLGYLKFGAQLEQTVNKNFMALNFGPDKAKTINVLELAKTCIDIWGSGKYEIINDTQAPKESDYLQLDSSHARRLLKWQPLLNSNDALSCTIDWYKRTIINNQSPYQVTLSQIEELSKDPISI
ncbi:MAG: CDP-glucose 4,6-dehydratase [Cyclobacteriaceae bacterium]